MLRGLGPSLGSAFQGRRKVIRIEDFRRRARLALEAPMKVWASTLSLLAGLVVTSPARAEQQSDGLDTARVSHIEGTLFGRGPYDTETSELAANAVVRAGDEIFTDEG